MCRDLLADFVDDTEARTMEVGCAQYATHGPRSERSDDIRKRPHALKYDIYDMIFLLLMAPASRMQIVVMAAEGGDRYKR